MDAGEFQRKAGTVTDAIRKFGRRASESPAVALLAALAAGFAAGLVLRLIEKPGRDERRAR